MSPNEKNFFQNSESFREARKRAARAAGEARAQQIRELPGAELAAFCLPNELAGEISRRYYYGQMNPAQLEFQATFDPDAAAELKRRNGELQR